MAFKKKTTSYTASINGKKVVFSYDGYDVSKKDILLALTPIFEENDWKKQGDTWCKENEDLIVALSVQSNRFGSKYGFFIIWGIVINKAGKKEKKLSKIKVPSCHLSGSFDTFIGKQNLCFSGLYEYNKKLKADSKKQWLEKQTRDMSFIRRALHYFFNKDLYYVDNPPKSKSAEEKMKVIISYVSEVGVPELSRFSTLDDLKKLHKAKFIPKETRKSIKEEVRALLTK